ncbi:hypothetical protein ACQPYK_08625 [Streptosporangium sp. CA-135522]|uniref:hypothetical protein n=1 Tax=Streptosporangium sp. CA-135522 TaxID=3240072 RepID=UPI003D908560
MSASILGVQYPRIRSVPPYARTSGPDVAELAERAGLVLDPWQRLFLDDALAEDERGKWVCFECGIIVSRQNGKGGIFEARVLGGLFLFDERLILYSAHEFKTASEFFLRIKSLIDGSDDLRRRVRKVITSHGDEGIELLSGQRLRIIARSRASGRGFSGDCNIMDEAFNLGPAQIGALMPTMSAMPNPQLYYGSSAGFEDSFQLGTVRARGITGGDPSLCFCEWSVPDDTLSALEGKPLAEVRKALADPRLHAMANPALGIRISSEFVLKELRSMDPETFARERLSIGTYPTEDAGWQIISEETWTAREDPESRRTGRVAFSLDITPDRTMGAIAVGGRRADGLLHSEVIDHQRGTGWMVERAVELVERHDPIAVVVDAAGPAGNLIADLQNAGIEVLVPTVREVGQACTGFYDAVMQDRVRHLGQAALTAAVAGAGKRTIGDGAWAWDRRHAAVDICPLVAATNAVWAVVTQPESDPLDNIW